MLEERVPRQCYLDSSNHELPCLENEKLYLLSAAPLATLLDITSMNINPH